MIKKILIPATFCVALVVPALAATSGSSGSTGSTSSANSGSMNNNGSTGTSPRIGTKLRQSLAQSGYTDIQVMPEAFLVHAKDKKGDPVVMMVRPNSVTEIKEVPMGKQASASGGGGGATGSGSSSGSSLSTRQQ